MCKVLEKYTKKKKFTGYKMVVKVDGKYYSPVTGIEYIPGKDIIPVKSESKVNRNFINSDSWKSFYEILKNKNLYEEKMHGKTGIFVERNIVDEFSQNETYIPVKMTISGDLHYAQTDWWNTIVGNHVVSIKELKN